jgi:hypothetical protein
LTRFPIEGKAARRLLFRLTKIDGRFSAALRRLSGKLMVEASISFEWTAIRDRCRAVRVF